MGDDEGSKLWEKNGRVLQGTTNPVVDRDSARLPPWMGTFPGANLVPGFCSRTRKVASFGSFFGLKVDGYGAPRRSHHHEFPFCI